MKTSIEWDISSNLIVAWRSFSICSKKPKHLLLSFWSCDRIFGTIFHRFSSSPNHWLKPDERWCKSIPTILRSFRPSTVDRTGLSPELWWCFHQLLSFIFRTYWKKKKTLYENNHYGTTRDSKEFKLVLKAH